MVQYKAPEIIVYKTKFITSGQVKCNICNKIIDSHNTLIADKRQSYSDREYYHRKCFLEQLSHEIKQRQTNISKYESEKKVYSLFAEVISHTTQDTDWISVYYGNQEYLVTPALQDESCAYCKAIIKKGALAYNGRCLTCLQKHYLMDPSSHIVREKKHMGILLNLLNQLTPKDTDGVAELLEEHNE